jgi:hypothetical protein
MNGSGHLNFFQSRPDYESKPDDNFFGILNPFNQEQSLYMHPQVQTVNNKNTGFDDNQRFTGNHFLALHKTTASECFQDCKANSRCDAASFGAEPGLNPNLFHYSLGEYTFKAENNIWVSYFK